MTKDQRAQIARQNGAKSRGPQNPKSIEACRLAALSAAQRRIAAVTMDCTLLPGESRATLDAVAAQELAFYQPSTPTERQLVHELIDVNWRIRRIRHSQTNDLQADMEAQRQRANAPILSTAMAAQAELNGSIDNGPQSILDRRVDRLAATRSRILRDLDRLAKRFPERAGSQPALQTEHLPAEPSWRVPTPDHVPPCATTTLNYAADPETLLVDPSETKEEPQPQNILEWAKNELEFEADAPQKELLTSESQNILMLGGRQIGKSTAAAIRVVHEAIHNPDSTILLAGPTGRQSGQIMVKAKQITRSLGRTTAGPPPGCEGFRLDNGSNIISLPDSGQTIRGFSAPRLIVIDEAAFVSDELITALKPMLAVSNGRMMLLSTPNGQSGYFFEKWHEEEGPWQRIECKASDCQRINAEMLNNMRSTMSEEEYSQEFDCKFLAAPGQFFTLDLIRRSFRSDVKPMFEDDDDD